ncbi:hypothetical protein AC1031_000580 [Aphanomyces cochlioides]|nr:hypothetical protein AC1031_000580 [Aphanomyces cochlioides]
MLKLMDQALSKAGVKCFMVHQKKDFENTLQQFKQYPDGCVLAMLYKHGANGLNVVEANHVILIEPLLNTGVEAQAINRIHRLGQEKQTTVHKFIVYNTVEEGIAVLQEKKRKELLLVKKNDDDEHVTWDDWSMLLQVDDVDLYEAFWNEVVIWNDKELLDLRPRRISSKLYWTSWARLEAISLTNQQLQSAGLKL